VLQWENKTRCMVKKERRCIFIMRNDAYRQARRLSRGPKKGKGEVHDVDYRKVHAHKKNSSPDESRRLPQHRRVLPGLEGYFGRDGSGLGMSKSLIFAFSPCLPKPRPTNFSSNLSLHPELPLLIELPVYK